MATTAPNRLSAGLVIPDFSGLQIRPAADATLAGTRGVEAVSNMLDAAIVRPKLREEQVSQIDANLAARPAETAARIQIANTATATGAVTEAKAKKEKKLLDDPDADIKEADAQIQAFRFDQERAQQKAYEELNPVAGEAPLTDEDRDRIMKQLETATKRAAGEIAGWEVRKKAALARRMADVKKSELEAVKTTNDITREQEAAANIPILARAEGSAAAATVRENAAEAARAPVQAQITALADQNALRKAQLEQVLLDRAGTPEAVAAQAELSELTLQNNVLEARRTKRALENALSGQPADVPAPQNVLDQFQKDWQIPLPPGTTYGQLQTLGQQQVNRKDAIPKLAEFEKTVQNDARLVNSAQQILNVVSGPDGIETGALYGFGPVNRVSGLLAQFGSVDDQKREQLRTYALDFVKEAKAGFTGSVSDYEQRLFQAASPGIDKSNETNIALASGAIAAAKRREEQMQFLRDRTANGAMSWEDAMTQWNGYIKANPVIKQDGKDGVVFNTERLSPNEWVAIQSGDPKAQESVIAARQNDYVNAIRSGELNLAEQPVGEMTPAGFVTTSEAPFVILNGAVVRNPRFWNKMAQ